MLRRALSWAARPPPLPQETRRCCSVGRGPCLAAPPRPAWRWARPLGVGGGRLRRDRGAAVQVDGSRHSWTPGVGPPSAASTTRLPRPASSASQAAATVTAPASPQFPSRRLRPRGQSGGEGGARCHAPPGATSSARSRGALRRGAWGGGAGGPGSCGPPQRVNLTSKRQFTCRRPPPQVGQRGSSPQTRPSQWDTCATSCLTPNGGSAGQRLRRGLQGREPCRVVISRSKTHL